MKWLSNIGGYVVAGILLIAIIAGIFAWDRLKDRARFGVKDGEKCSNDKMCASGHCFGVGKILDGRCGLPDLGDGSGCHVDAQCTSKRCIEEVCVSR